jgi:hypothetical protein
MIIEMAQSWGFLQLRLAARRWSPLDYRWVSMAIDAPLDRTHQVKQLQPIGLSLLFYN